MRLFLHALLLLFAASALAVEFSKAEVGGQKFTVCRVKVAQERLQLFLRDEKGKTLRKFDRLAAWLQADGRKLVFAMNAGMYRMERTDFAAQGLFVADGKETEPLNSAEGWGNFFLKPNGVFAVTAKGARIVETSEYPQLGERVQLATQSGPMLVRRGVIHPKFMPASTSRLLRNGVGVPSLDTAIFVISETPVNFHEFASFFRDQLHCPDALFLDGTVSSLYSTELKRSDFRIDLGPMFGVTE